MAIEEIGKKKFSASDSCKKFPAIRVVMDGTEVRLDKPKQPVAQQTTCSTRKNRNTAKVRLETTCRRCAVDQPVIIRYV